MTWNEFKLKVDTYLSDNDRDDVEIDYIDVVSLDYKELGIGIDEYGLSIWS